MKSLTILALAAVLSPMPAARAQSPAIRTVYVMPMAGGLDQHLADWITRNHVYQVVTDPKTADAFLTERIGSTFEQTLAEWLPPSADDKDKDKKDSGSGSGSGSVGRGGLKSTSSRGTIFLVAAKSRQVVWSDFEKPVDLTPTQLDREAERIAKKLAGPSTAK